MKPVGGAPRPGRHGGETGGRLDDAAPGGATDASTGDVRDFGTGLILSRTRDDRERDDALATQEDEAEGALLFAVGGLRVFRL
jgi:hypothetical protein